MQLSTEFLKGVCSPKNAANLELDVKASFSFIDDTLKLKKNLQRQIFNFEPGINLVLKGKKIWTIILRIQSERQLYKYKKEKSLS